MTIEQLRKIEQAKNRDEIKMFRLELAWKINFWSAERLRPDWPHIFAPATIVPHGGKFVCPVCRKEHKDYLAFPYLVAVPNPAAICYICFWWAHKLTEKLFTKEISRD